MTASAVGWKARAEVERAMMPEVEMARMPVDAYLAASYRPDREWVEGELRERRMGEGPHAVVQKFLAMFLGMREEEWSILALTEQRVQVAVGRYRVPDVCVLRADQPFEVIVRRAPLLCVEILSAGDTASEMLERVEDYRRMGVGTVWLVDPRRRAASIGSADGAMRPVERELEVAGTAIRLTLREMFAQLDRLEGVAPRES